MTHDLTVRDMTAADLLSVLELYRATAQAPGSGLAREPEEITEAYVRGFLTGTGAGGISLGAFGGDELLGELHASRLAPRQFAHVLTDLTVAVRPSHQGRGVGAQLFNALFKRAARLTPPVTRIELVARSGNVAGIRLYERLGFEREGRFLGRVHLAHGTVEDDIPMAKMI